MFVSGVMRRVRLAPDRQKRLDEDEEADAAIEAPSGTDGRAYRCWGLRMTAVND